MGQESPLSVNFLPLKICTFLISNFSCTRAILIRVEQFFSLLASFCFSQKQYSKRLVLSFLPFTYIDDSLIICGIEIKIKIVVVQTYKIQTTKLKIMLINLFILILVFSTGGHYLINLSLSMFSFLIFKVSILIGYSYTAGFSLQVLGILDRYFFCCWCIIVN